jgi:cold shock CspA family protein
MPAIVMQPMLPASVAYGECSDSQIRSDATDAAQLPVLPVVLRRPAPWDHVTLGQVVLLWEWRTAVNKVAMGKVVRYDEHRGYGFIAPDGGGDDVFVHVNDLEFSKYFLTPGARVQFEIEDGGKGLKASTVQLVDQPEGAAPPARAGAVVSLVKDLADSEDDDLCDMLSAKEFLDELTESLIISVPTLTVGQLHLIRQQLVSLAQEHGWLERET